MLSRSKATIKTNGMHTYLLTISKHQKKDYVDKSDLNAIIVTLKWKHPSLTFTEYSYENTGKYRQLHFHGLCRVNGKIMYKDNNSINGYRLQWKPVWDTAGAIKYITKDTQGNKYRQEQILVENYYNHNYGFISTA